MARNSKTGSRRSTQSSTDSAQAVRDSAQKIWLAGLGAFERARTEGPRMFETLVEQGRKMGARAVGAADEALKTMREANYAGGNLDKLEKVFEERVSRSLNRLGVLTSKEVEALSEQVRELNEAVQRLMTDTARASSATGRGRAGAATGAKRARKAAAARGRKAAAKPRAKAKAGRKAKAAQPG